MTEMEYILIGVITGLILVCVYLYFRMRKHYITSRRNQYVINRMLISLGMDLQDSGYATQKSSEEQAFIKKWYDKLNKLEKRKKELESF